MQDEQPFVAMEKDAEIIDVHPSNVEQHQRLGWRLVPPARAAAAPVAAEGVAAAPHAHRKGKG